MSDVHPKIPFELTKDSKSNIGVGHSLGSPTPKSSCFFEITINHPRNKGFINLLSKSQKKHLYSIFQIVIKHFGNTVKDHDHVFELCQDGVIHLHGWIELELDSVVPMILVNDIAKIYLRCFPKKYQNYSPKNFYEKYNRYRCPSIVVQYQEEKREAWLEYMRKNPI